MAYDLQPLLARLAEMADDRYRAFNERLTPGAEGTSLGVRLPALRALAKEIARGDAAGFPGRLARERRARAQPAARDGAGAPAVAGADGGAQGVRAGDRQLGGLRRALRRPEAQARRTGRAGSISRIVHRDGRGISGALRLRRADAVLSRRGLDRRDLPPVRRVSPRGLLCAHGRGMGDLDAVPLPARADAALFWRPIRSTASPTTRRFRKRSNRAA